MAAKPAYRNRPDVQVAVLDALVDRRDDGMTVFELRTAVDADIDRIEDALSGLKDDGLITVEQGESRFRVYPHEKVVPDPEPEPSDRGLIDQLRGKFGL